MSLLLALRNFGDFNCSIDLFASRTMDRVYNIFTLSALLRNRETTLEWLRDIELIPRERYCRTHEKNMALHEGHLECGEFICQKKSKYNHSASVAENTWFERCHLSPACFMLMTYSFSINLTFNQTVRERSIVEGQQLSTETVSDRFSFCREVCMAALDQEFEAEGRIGGVGKIVEIDECKIGRRKYERGRVVEGTWILGMVHRGHPHSYRLKICPENKRNAATLLALIRKHVVVGTEIHTDCWKGYDCLETHSYLHKTVNHLVEFVNPETGAHTQNIESSWRWMRRSLAQGGVRTENLVDHLCEFVWRRRVKKKERGSFHAICRRH